MIESVISGKANILLLFPRKSDDQFSGRNTRDHWQDKKTTFNDSRRRKSEIFHCLKVLFLIFDAEPILSLLRKSFYRYFRGESIYGLKNVSSSYLALLSV